VWGSDLDGYDGASETGRCETDGVDDLGTECGDPDGDGVEEEDYGDADIEEDLDADEIDGD
jgi:hypothetical protein